MLLYDKKYLSMEFDEKNQCLIQYWKGYASSEQFREGIAAAYELYKKYKAPGMICDTKEQAIVKKEDTDFAATYVPEFIKLGLKNYAFVLPTNVFGKISVDNFKKQSDDLITIRYFDNLEKAKEWVKES